MKISELFNYENIVYLEKPLDMEKELRIESDTSAVDENSIFFCYRSVRAEAPYKLPEFQNNKPYAIVCEWDANSEQTDIPLIKVKNVRSALAHSYSRDCGINYSSMKIIGVTGTNGKTSTAEMIFRILRENGNSVGFIGTGIIKINDTVLTDIYYSMTTPDPLLLYPALKKMQDEECSYVVMEVSSHSIALSKIAPIHFECCAFTNLSAEHTDFHKDMEDYYQTKLSLFNNSKKGVFNLDDEYSRRAYNEVTCAKYSVGVVRRGDGYIIDFCSHGLGGSSYFYKDDALIFKTRLKLAGAYNVYNALIATKCALTLGVRACTVKKALENIVSLRGRFEVIEDEIKVVIDYAHTPMAFENLIKSLNSAKTMGQKLILVFGCGGNRDSTKREVMGKIAEENADFIILTEDNSRDENTDNIISDISRGIDKKEVYTVIKNREEAIRYAIDYAKTNDIVAVVGKGHEQYIIDNSGRHPFDEKGIINDALAGRRKNNENKA